MIGSDGDATLCNELLQYVVDHFPGNPHDEEHMQRCVDYMVSMRDWLWMEDGTEEERLSRLLHELRTKELPNEIVAHLLLRYIARHREAIIEPWSIEYDRFYDEYQHITKHPKWLWR